MVIRDLHFKGDNDLNCLTIGELERHARDLMDKQTRDYYNEGADSGSTLKENLDAYQKYRIRPRVLRDVSNIDTSVNLFGFQSSIPMGVAPTAMQKLAHHDGELGTARACQKAEVPMGLSSFATTSLEDVREASGHIPNVLQLYLFEERAHSAKLIKRAKQAGFKAVFLTVDTPYLGRRNLEIRNQFKLPPHFKIANFAGREDDEKPIYDEDLKAQANESRKVDAPSSNTKVPSKAGYTGADGKRVLPEGSITFHTHAANPTLSWEKDIEWLKEQCCPEMEVWVKGIATAEDALLAVHHQVRGIVVSNHGGRQLNGALATLDALPEVVEAVQGKIPVHVDGGIRHGTDVFKALALGADFVWVGRPALWGLAYKGQAGVELMLKILADEIKLTMALAGVTRVKDISKEYLVKVSCLLVSLKTLTCFADNMYQIDKSGFVARL
ncbi:FMN-dependent dehydrogenase [Teratosphaeria destructans]|uniref:FMN-dependent dehydrogenase n=1 Tax=Teratosphaeria destructans TaxID=418781 RepID=A0A9W7SQQ8_9PEZI|nr:FMN-dependent dehydrogenase [Teratosphaeria destructans]